MRLFYSTKALTRKQAEDLFEKASEKFLKTHDAESKSEVIELHDCLEELDAAERAQVSVLQLRDHSLMKRKSGYVIWPPVWAKMGDNNSTFPLKGEIGYLDGVLRNEDREALNKLLFLIITHEGSKYIGAMSFDDSTFCSELCELLKSKVGLSIKEIGDLDLSHLF